MVSFVISRKRVVFDTCGGVREVGKGEGLGEEKEKEEEEEERDRRGDLLGGRRRREAAMRRIAPEVRCGSGGMRMVQGQVKINWAGC